MAFKDNLIKRRDGSFILKHKTKKHKKGDCIECGENPKDRPFGGLYEYNARDVQLVRNHIEEHLTFYTGTKSGKPEWCTECKSLKKYVFELYDPKTLRSNKNKWKKHAK